MDTSSSVFESSRKVLLSDHICPILFSMRFTENCGLSLSHDEKVHVFLDT